jgi:hypothetical protein
LAGTIALSSVLCPCLVTLPRIAIMR